MMVRPKWKRNQEQNTQPRGSRLVVWLVILVLPACSGGDRPQLPLGSSWDIFQSDEALKARHEYMLDTVLELPGRANARLLARRRSEEQFRQKYFWEFNARRQALVEAWNERNQRDLSYYDALQTRQREFDARRRQEQEGNLEAFQSMMERQNAYFLARYGRDEEGDLNVFNRLQERQEIHKQRQDEATAEARRVYESILGRQQELAERDTVQRTGDLASFAEMLRRQHAYEQQLAQKTQGSADAFSALTERQRAQNEALARKAQGDEAAFFALLNRQGIPPEKWDRYRAQYLQAFMDLLARQKMQSEQYLQEMRTGRRGPKNTSWMRVTPTP